ncbi:MAG: AAA family ATPase [Caldilineaceae bacterium]
MTYYPEFARLLNEELQRQERPASWLAQRLGVSPSTVARWLNHGTRPRSPEVVRQIVDSLGVTAHYQSFLAAAGFGYQPSAPTSSMEPPIAERLPGIGQTENAPTLVTEPATRLARLPTPTTPLIGRKVECAQLAEWLADPALHLVTIVGPGGMGKTRLALAVAQQQIADSRYQHGVVFVDLAPLTAVDQIPAAIAQAVGLPLESSSDPNRSSRQQVLDFLADRRLLLLLDNAEHLLDGAAFIAAILATAPHVQILVTSRAPLRLPGEQRYPLHGLDYTTEAIGARTENAAAVVLFLQAARRVRPDYGVDAHSEQRAHTATEQSAIAAICSLVEGMPLAIELAASWVTMMSAAEILAAIHASLHFLETDLRGVSARHRSMEAVFDATWQRLNQTERQIFAQLSVFRGGFTQAAISRVTGATPHQLRSLATSSLIVYNHERERYTIHELLRQYGALRLAETPEVEAATNHAHSAFYLDLLTCRQDALKSRGLQTDLAVLDAEVDNLSQAWRWAAQQGHVDRLTATMDGWGLYLQWRGRAAEGETAFQWAAMALERANALRWLPRTLTWQAIFARILGQADRAMQLLGRSRRLLTDPTLAHEDLRSEHAFVLMQLGAAAAGQDTVAAQHYYEQSLALFQALQEQWFAAEVLLGLGQVCLVQGDFAGQRAYVQEALETYRTLGNVRGTAAALSMLADIDTYRGQLLRGLDLGLESLAAFRSLGDPHGTATCLSRIGMTYMDLGDLTNARQVVTESAALFADIGSRRDEVIAYAFLCAIELMAGDYPQALANAERSHTIAGKLDDQFVQGVAIGFVGWAQLYAGNLHGALQTLRKAVIITKQTGATMDQVRWSSQLGLAQWQNGQGQQARFYCYESLRLSAQVADPWSLLTAISSTIAILADGENPVRAVELHSMLMEDSLCAASQWYADGVGCRVNKAMAQLPTSVIEAAQLKGITLNQQAAAAQLLAEVQALGWDR